MDIVVTTIKQIGREILLDGNSLIGYQHSANLFIKLMKDTSESNPFAGMVLSAYCSSWKSDMPIVCPLQEKEDGAYILLPEGVFDHDGDIYLSLAAIDDNKIVITSNQLTLQVDESNRIVSKVSPSEKYWEIEVLNAMKVWYTEVVNPTFTASEEKLNQLIRRTEEHEEKAEDLQKKAEEQQTAVDQSVASAAQATQTANAAATNANEKAAAANTAAQAANKAKNDADTATSNANKAASDANAAASNANTKAGAAATAASQANAARDSANSIVQTVQQKLDNGEFDGRTTYTGIGDPAVILGKDGDTYLNKSNEGEYPQWLYLKEGGKWIPLWKTQGEDGTDTVPVGAGYVISGDEIPAGYKEAIPPFSNPDLLINGDFRINQRGQNEYPSGAVKYTVDRWIRMGCAVTVGSDGITLNTVGNSANGAFGQNIETLEVGKKYTVCINITSLSGTGEVSIGTRTDFDNVGHSNTLKQGVNKITFTATGKWLTVCSKNVLITIEYVKLEYGEIATPFVPRPYAEELMLCMRTTIAYKDNEKLRLCAQMRYAKTPNDMLGCSIFLPTMMRTVPTKTMNSVQILSTHSNNEYIGKITGSYFQGNSLYLFVKKQDETVFPVSTDIGYNIVINGLILDAEIY